MGKHILYVIPVCPFCQRIEIILAMKGVSDKVEIRPVDVTKPRDPELLRKTRGYEATPVLETADGQIIKESLVIMEYLDSVFPGTPVVISKDPYKRAVENMFTALTGDFIGQGYSTVMNREADKAEAQKAALLEQYAVLNDFLVEHSPNSTFLFESPGWAEAVITPFFQRWWLAEYYENFKVPDNDPKYARVQKFVAACLALPTAQQVTFDYIVKSYYDYSLGFGNGALPPNRQYSSFSFVPDWRSRPMPPKNKWGPPASDAELGLIPANGAN
jgi:glutathione S-transferase